MMKMRKKIVSVAKIAFEGGVSLSTETTHSFEQLQQMLEQGMRKRELVVIDSVNGQEEIADDKVTVDMSKALFFMVAKLNDSPIKLAQGIMPGVQ